MAASMHSSVFVTDFQQRAKCVRHTTVNQVNICSQSAIYRKLECCVQVNCSHDVFGEKPDLISQIATDFFKFLTTCYKIFKELNITRNIYQNG